MRIMAKKEQGLPSPTIRLWRYLPILLVLGLAVQLLVPKITTLEHSWTVIKSLTWWALALAVTAQILSYLGSGYILHAILAANGQRLSVFLGALITLASASVGLVAGGWVSAAATTYGWIQQESRNENAAILAGIIPALLYNAVLVGVALIGTIFLFLLNELSKIQLIGFGIVVLALSLLTGGVIIALRNPQIATRFMIWSGSRWAKLRHKAFDAENSAAAVKRFVDAWNSLRGDHWYQPVLGAVANIGFDILTLFFMFMAAGYHINLGVLLAGYGLPFILGKVAFLLPGGIGVIEGSMVALYESLQVPGGVCVVVILGYRLISFWLPALLGFLAATYLSSRSSKLEK
jgi:uncharacterized protein (TIRG00374 family)